MRRNGIKKTVTIRVIAALVSMVLFSCVTTFNIFHIQNNQADSKAFSSVLNRVQQAETAHYKWSANLSNALYAGTEFTGSVDPTGCVLGKWLYGEAGTDDPEILALRNQLEPLHKELHESATEVLTMLESNTPRAQSYYQQTILTNLNTLVGMMDQVVERSQLLNEESQTQVERTIHIMHITCAVCLVLALLCLLSLVQYVMRRVVRPIILLTENVRPLQDGCLDLDLSYAANDELGDLAKVLRDSLRLIHSYIADINRMMDRLSAGDFNVQTSAPFIGDFCSIEQSIESFTNTISGSLGQINQAEHRISGNAEQLSNGAQSLAQGATEQASAVEEMYATLDELTKSSKQNVETVSSAKRNAQQAGEQVTVSGEQMEDMVAAMSDITSTSQQIQQIIATIENIAFQTNILALNAAVEAARAGAAGKGFAVVADEVRSLAAQSDQAAKATKELIENSVQATQRGSKIVDGVSATLKETLELVMRSSSDISEIAEAVQSEAASIAQVAEGVGQISSVVQTNSASSEESAAVSAELFNQVKFLQEQTRQFHLKGAGALHA